MNSAIFGSWKTSASGIIAGIMVMILSLAGLGGVPVPVIEDGSVVLDENGAVVTEAPSSFDLQTFLMGLGLAGIGAAARDNDKKSESVGAK